MPGLILPPAAAVPSISPIPPRPQTGRRYVVPYFGTPNATTLATGTAYATPFTVPTTVDTPYAALRIESVAAVPTAQARVGIYAASLYTYEPTTLLYDLGVQAMSAATTDNLWTLTAAQGAFPAGMYAVVLAPVTANPNVRTVNSPQTSVYLANPVSTNTFAGFSMTVTAGVLPTTWSTGASIAAIPRAQFSL